MRPVRVSASSLVVHFHGLSRLSSSGVSGVVGVCVSSSSCVVVRFLRVLLSYTDRESFTRFLREVHGCCSGVHRFVVVVVVEECFLVSQVLVASFAIWYTLLSHVVI